MKIEVILEELGENRFRAWTSRPFGLSVEEAIAGESEAWELTSMQQTELDGRVAAYDSGPHETFTWQDVKASLRMPL